MSETKKHIIRGTITAVSGLAIGGSNSAMSIGGVDKGVIRNPATDQPYIPGSTLKGKMRSLIELRDGTVGNVSMGVVKHGPSTEEGVLAVKIFGNASGKDEYQRPSRVIVRDAALNKEQVKSGFFKNMDLPYTEIKTEVVIDRITSKAMPRQMERVPAGAEFDFEVILNVFQDEEKHETSFVTNIFNALQLVQNDYIGGSGSRGSGQVAFGITSVFSYPMAFYGLDTKDEVIDLMDTYKAFFPK
jgi:CRISPR-associated protein Csm3